MHIGRVIFGGLQAAISGATHLTLQPARAASIIEGRMATGWICPNCGEANGSAIYRCKSCFRARPNTTLPAPSVESPHKQLTQSELALVELVKAATPIRAAWLTWWGHVPTRLDISLSVVFLLIVCLGTFGPNAGGVGGLVGGLLGSGSRTYSQLRPYRSDRAFRLAFVTLVVGAGAGLLAVWALSGAIIPRPGGDPPIEAFIRSLAPGVDPYGVFFAGLIAIAGGLILRAWLTSRNRRLLPASHASKDG